MSAQLDQLHYNLGCVLQQQGKREAAECYRQAIALNPQHRNAYNNLGCVLIQQRQFEAAIAIYQQAIAHFPGWAVLHNNLGQALAATGEMQAAIAAYRHAIDCQPDLAIAHYNLGRAWQQQGQHTEAIACFQTLLQLDPTQRAGYGDGAISLIALNRWHEAMDWLRRAIAQQPLFVIAFREWASQLTDSDELTQAKIACAQFLKRLQDNASLVDVLESLAQTYLNLGNVLTAYGGTQPCQQAEIYYRHALRLQPDRPQIHYQLGKLFEQQQQLEGAIACYRAALTLQSPVVMQGDRLTNRFNEPPLKQSEVLAPSLEAKLRCAGLNCEPCLQQLNEAFQPIHLGNGFYQCVGHASSEISLVSSSTTVDVLPQGRAWITPQQNFWQVCRAIAIFNADGAFVPPLSRAYPAQLPNCQQVEIDFPDSLHSLPPVETIDGSVAVLAGLSGHVYFHWMVDILPRLDILRSHDWLDQVDWFVVNSLEQPFQRETLTQLGIPLEKVIESDRHPHLQATRLIVPSFAGALGWVQPWALQFLRQMLLHTNSTAPDSPQRLYISRANAHYRRVINEAEVIDLVRSHGFTPVTLESLSLAEQVNLFAHARAIVAPHGSGLTNLVVCPPKTQVIELVSPHYIRPYYWVMSQQLGLNHYFLKGQAFDCQPLRELMYLNPLTEDLMVDLDALQHSLNHLEL